MKGAGKSGQNSAGGPDVTLICQGHRPLVTLKTPHKEEASIPTGQSELVKHKLSEPFADT